MTHDRLWAPWRLAYVAGDERKPPTGRPALPELTLLSGGDPQCFMCRAAADTADRENLLVARGVHTLILLNRYPYSNGHLLVAPRLHQARLDELTPEVQLELFQTIARLTGILERVIGAEGFNIGLNLGQVAGAGVPGHLHWHIVPRWAGDINFMPTVAATSVIPQSLDELWQILHAELKEE